MIYLCHIILYVLLPVTALLTKPPESDKVNVDEIWDKYRKEIIGRGFYGSVAHRIHYAYAHDCQLVYFYDLLMKIKYSLRGLFIVCCSFMVIFKSMASTMQLYHSCTVDVRPLPQILFINQHGIQKGTLFQNAIRHAAPVSYSAVTVEGVLESLHSSDVGIMQRVQLLCAQTNSFHKYICLDNNRRSQEPLPDAWD